MNESVDYRRSRPRRRYRIREVFDNETDSLTENIRILVYTSFFPFLLYLGFDGGITVSMKTILSTFVKTIVTIEFISALFDKKYGSERNENWKAKVTRDVLDIVIPLYYLSKTNKGQKKLREIKRKIYGNDKCHKSPR